MCPPSTTRRSVLRTGGSLAAVLASGTLAGCLDSLGDGGTAGSRALSSVPPMADAVFTVDVNTVLADDAVHTTYDAWLETQAETQEIDGPTSLTETLDEFAQSDGYDLRDISKITAFASFDSGQIPTSNDGLAYIFETGWDEATMLSTTDYPADQYTETTYEGYTMYESEREYVPTLGVLEDGRYVLGGDDAIRSTMDVDRDEADPIDGAVLDAYQATTAGPIRFGTKVEEGWFPEEVDGENQPLDLSPLEAVETAGGAIYRDGNTRGIELLLDTPDDSTAGDLSDVLDGLLTLASNESKRATTPQFISAILEDVAVEQEGESVALSVERTIAELEEVATQMAGQTSGSAGGGSGSDGPRSPQVSLDWDYDEAASAVTITHAGGDAIDADNLTVDGDGFASVDGADMTAAGQWAGGTNDDGEVVAGSRVTVGAEPDCSLYVVWSGDGASAMLGQFSGPEA